MTIFRVKKDRENPYVMIHKGFLEDQSISLKLKGFLAYCLSKPDDWKFHARQLASVLKEGKAAVYSVIDEGIEQGYIERISQKKEGLFDGVEYVIYETKLKKSLPHPENQDTEDQRTETRTLLINNQPTNEKTKEKEREEGAPPIPTFFSDRRVKMDQAKYDKLVLEHGLEKIKKFIDRLDEYADINPRRFKQYACHAAVIRKWMREETEKTTALPQKVNFKFENENFAEHIYKKLQHPSLDFHRGKSITIATGGAGLPIELSFANPTFKEALKFELQKRRMVAEDKLNEMFI